MKTFLTLLVTLLACFYIFYGAAVVVSKDASLMTIVFGMVSVSYGIAAFYIVVALLVKAKPVNTTIVNILGGVFLVLYIAGALDSGIISGHEVWGFFMAAVPFIIIWLSLKKIQAIKSRLMNS